MKRTGMFLVFGLVLAISTNATRALGAHTTVPVAASAMVSTSVDGRPAYVLTFDIPSALDGRRLDSALLEFYVDAALVSTETPEHDPTIDVRALSSPYRANVALESSAAVGRSRPLRSGSRQKVVIDITDIVKAWILDPTANHGLVIGSLGGSRAGNFTMRSDVMGQSKTATVTFFYQNRSGERISSHQR